MLSWWKNLASEERGAYVGGLSLLVFAALLSLHWEPGNIGHHDTAYYLDGARQLASGNGFVSAESSISGQKIAIANWPPGFSLLMVPGIWLGLSVQTSAAFVLGGSYAVLLVSTYALLLLGTTARFWPVALFSCVAFGLTPSLLDMENRLLSDLSMSAAVMSAAAISVALLRQEENWRKSPSGYGWAAGLGGLFASIILIRWAGMFAAFGLVLSFLLCLPLAKIRKHLSLVAVCLGTCALLVGGWMLRNMALTGEAMGRRVTKLSDPALHVERALGGSLMWATDVRDLLGAESSEWFAYSAVLFALSGFLLLAAARARLEKNSACVFLTGTAGSYTVGIVLSAALHPFNSLLHPRYWIFVWATLLCVSLFVAVHARGRFVWPLRGLLALCLLIFGAVGQKQYQNRHPASVTPQRTLVDPVHEIADEMMKRKCQIVSNETRVLMVGSAYERLYRFPNSKRQLQKLHRNGPLCIVWLRPEGASRTKVASKQRGLIEWAKKQHYIHLDRRKSNYEVWLPGRT